MNKRKVNLLKIVLLLVFMGQAAIYNQARACHALAVVNPSVVISGGNLVIDGSSDASTFGCGPYYMDVEITCNTLPFTGNPNYQSPQIQHPNQVQVAYTTLNIPLGNFCPGVTYKCQIREHILNTQPGQSIGPWSQAFVFTTPGTYPAIFPNVPAPSMICPGQSVQLTSNPTGGCQSPYTYSWSHGLGTAASVSVSPTVTTTYTVTVSDQCGGSNTQAIIVPVAMPPVMGTATVSPNPVCPGGCVTLSVVSNAGTGGNSLQWQMRVLPGSWQNIPGATTNSYQYCPVNSQTLFRACITNPCFAPLYSNLLTVTVAQPPSAVITGQPGNSCNNLPLPYTAPGQTNVTYSWAVTGGTPTSGTGNSINVTWNSNGGSITLTATNTVTGCVSTSTLFIPPCCTGTLHELVINNRTASSLINDPTFSPYIFLVNGVYELRSQYIIINGVFTVDVPFTLVPGTAFPSSVKLGGNAQVWINSGITFTVDNYDFVACQYMWDGIYIKNSTAKLVTKNGATFSGAKKSVVSLSGGDYDLSNTAFFDNYSCVDVEPYAGSHTGTIRTCTFTTSGNAFTPSMPAAFPLVNRTKIGVEVHNVGSITIGDPTNAAYNNIFDNVGFNILSDNSNTKVYNNTFRQNNTSYSASTVGVTANSSPLTPTTVIIGGTGTNEPNTFDNTVNGIKATAGTNVIILNNTITNTTNTGISVSQCGSTNTIDIENNVLTNFANGINCTNNPFATITIKKNDLNLTGATVAAQTGIVVQNATQQPTDMTITQNRVFWCKTDIKAVNIVAPSTATNPPRIVYNTVDFANFTTASINSSFFGILAQNVRNVTIENNVLSRNINPVSAISGLLRGIQVENCQKSQVNYNQLVKQGRGVNMRQFVPASKLTCNDFNSNYYGLYFNNSLLLGDQYVGGLTNDNTYSFASIGGTDIAGINTPIANWYYQNAIPYIPLNPTAGGFNVTTSTGSTACGTINPPPVQEREDYLGSIVRYENSYDENGDEIRYWERQTAYWELYHNSSWLNLRTSDDADYQNFYDTEDGGNIGLFMKVLEDVNGNDVASAIGINDAIEPENTIEANRKAANSVFLDTWAQGYEELDQTQIDLLTEIAYMDPLTNGDAVYTARVMVGIEPDQGDSRLQAPTNATPGMFTTSNVYPNPNNGRMSMDYELKEGSKGELSIFDLQGRRIKNVELEQGKHSLEVDGSDMPSGVYLYNVSINGSIVTTNKLVIIK